MAKKRNKKVVEKQKNKKQKDKGVWFIPAGALLGMGFGIFIHNFAAGLFFGLGLGFLVFAIINLLKKKN